MVLRKGQCCYAVTVRFTSERSRGSGVLCSDGVFVPCIIRHFLFDLELQRTTKTLAHFPRAGRVIYIKQTKAVRCHHYTTSIPTASQTLTGNPITFIHVRMWDCKAKITHISSQNYKSFLRYVCTPNSPIQNMRILPLAVSLALTLSLSEQAASFSTPTQVIHRTWDQDLEAQIMSAVKILSRHDIDKALQELLEPDNSTGWQLQVSSQDSNGVNPPTHSALEFIQSLVDESGRHGRFYAAYFAHQFLACARSSDVWKQQSRTAANEQSVLSFAQKNNLRKISEMACQEQNEENLNDTIALVLNLLQQLAETREASYTMRHSEIMSVGQEQQLNELKRQRSVVESNGILDIYQELLEHFAVRGIMPGVSQGYNDYYDHDLKHNMLISKL